MAITSIPLEPCNQGFLSLRSCHQDLKPQHEQPQNQQFLLYVSCLTTCSLSLHLCGQSSVNEGNSTYKNDRCPSKLEKISKHAGAVKPQYNKEKKQTENGTKVVFWVNENETQVRVPSSKIKRKLNNHFESQLPSPVLYKIRFQSTPRQIFHNNTTHTSWHAYLTILSLYLQP